ncbi:hypothetical protein Q7A53_16990 [Halobacillus rhizosphaerae]
MIVPAKMPSPSLNPLPDKDDSLPCEHERISPASPSDEHDYPDI